MGAGAFILIIVCILALFFKEAVKREDRREIKSQKSEQKRK